MPGREHQGSPAADPDLVPEWVNQRGVLPPERPPRRALRRVIWGLAAAVGIAGLTGVVAVVAFVGADGSRQAPDEGRVASTNGRDGNAETNDGERGERSVVDQRPEAIRWRESVAVGEPSAGELLRGVRLPTEGSVYFTWDPIQKERPNRGSRRWGTDGLVRTTLRVLREFAADNPSAPRVGVGDLSRRRGGDFGPQYGLPGHASHQSGLDIDVYYPRLDRRERPPEVPSQVDLDYGQDLVDRFVRAGAEKVFVGPSLDLVGPSKVVIPLVNHDNHIHVRLPTPATPA